MRFTADRRRVALALGLVFLSTLLAGAQQITKDAVLQAINAFQDSFAAYDFGKAISLGSQGKWASAFALGLNVEAFPPPAQTGISSLPYVPEPNTLSGPGKFYPPNALLGGGAFGMNLRDPMLAVRTTDGLNSPVTLWHESIHYLIYLNGGQPCGPEETYAELCEERVQWLRKLVTFEKRYKGGLFDYAELKKEWEGLEKEWNNYQNPKNLGAKNLSGPYTWSDADKSCGKAAALYTIDRQYIDKLDTLLGISIDINKIRPLYKFYNPSDVQLGSILQLPVLDIHQNQSYPRYALWENTQSSLTLHAVVWQGDYLTAQEVQTGKTLQGFPWNSSDSVAVTATCSCQLPQELVPGQRFAINVDCKYTPTQAGAPGYRWQTPYVSLELPHNDLNTAPFHEYAYIMLPFRTADGSVDEGGRKAPGTGGEHVNMFGTEISQLPDGKRSMRGEWVFGQFAANAGTETVVERDQQGRVTGGRVVYGYRQPSDNPPANITLKMNLQGTGMADYATLTWRYTPKPQPPQAASPAQPQALAKANVPAQERTLARTAPQAAPRAPATGNAGDLGGLWTIAVTSQKGAWTSLARATQEGNRVTFRAQNPSGADAGDLMRGTLAGGNLEVEFGNTQGTQPGRGTLIFNPRTGEFEGDVVSTGLPVHLKITRAR